VALTTEYIELDRRLSWRFFDAIGIQETMFCLKLSSTSSGRVIAVQRTFKVTGTWRGVKALIYSGRYISSKACWRMFK
jgi:hypothetical protein